MTRAGGDEAMQGSRGARKGRRIFLSVLVVLLAGAASVTAAIAASSAHTNRRTLTYTQSAGGTGSVQSKPKGIKCGAVCLKAVASMYENDTVVLKAKASNGSKLEGWTGCEAETVSSAEGTCSVKMTKDQAVEAIWGGESKAIANPQPLTVSKGESSGAGTVKGTGGLGCETECTSTTVLYQGETGVAPKVKLGKTVTLQEAAAFGSEFTGWSGGGCSGAGETCTVTMNAAATVTATFTAKPITTLMVEKVGTGTGTVSSKPKALNCGTTCTSQSAAVPEEAEVVLKEKPATGLFEGWTGACTGAGEICTAKLSAAGTVTAKFGGTAKAILNAQALTLNKAGSGYGTVKAAGLACEVLCTSTTNLYQGPTGVAPKNKPGKTVILKAASARGSKQVVWTGCESEPTPTECSVTMKSAKTVTATFDEATTTGASVTPELSLCGEISHNETIGPDYAEHYVLTCDVTVDAGATLSIEAGAVLKANDGTALIVNGTLEANGTAEKPVTLTSWRDDTVGGDTNGDGNATAPVAGDWGGIYTSPAGDGNPDPTLDLDHVKVAYAIYPVHASQATTSITNSTIEKATGEGVLVSSPVGIPTVTGNTVSHVDGEAIAVYNASLDMGTLNGNSGSANGLNGVQLGGDTVTVSSSLPWSGNLVPVLNGGCASLSIPPGIKLTLGAGTIVKAQGNCGGEVQVQGTLEANGTAEKPVTLTSWRDDTVGGDTNGDGNATAPVAGDWGGIYTSPAGDGNPDPTLDLDHVKVAYASSAITFSGDTARLSHMSITKVDLPLQVSEGSVSFRGSLAGNANGITACDWATNCSVDAAYTYWESPEGPFPSGKPALACGAVTTYPYLISEAGAASEEEAGGFGAENCSGSPTPWEQLASGQIQFNEGIAHAASLCAELGDDVCEVIDIAFGCLSGAFDLGASQLPFFSLPNPFSGGSTAEGWQEGATITGKAGAAYLKSSADPLVADIGSAASRGFQILSVGSTYLSLANAYSQCAP